MIKFPEGFLFGTATSATQSEGGQTDGKASNIWDFWYKEEPYKFHNQIGPEKTSNFYFDYKENVKLLEETGQNSYRTSISWSRLIPAMDGKVNTKAVDFYKRYFKELKASFSV